MKNKTLLVLAAHPDDVEILAAGTLSRLRDIGFELFLGHMTFGDKGGTQDPTALSATRKKEAESSAALIGAKVVGRLCGDLELYNNDIFVEQVFKIINKVKPDVILTHRKNDYHPDHRIIGELVLRVVREKSILTSVWFMDAIGGVDFIPTKYVDITQERDLKDKMILCHESQMAWMSQARNTNMVYMAQSLDRWRGLQSGFEYAEGFMSMDGMEEDWFGSLLNEMNKYPRTSRKD
jgi:LmbE family N-acetylglucosaminyl deacetylase